jgi:c-di-GMP-binding flagellar brake protein YcgR
MTLGDRRSRVRLEVVGTLWATLDVREPTRLVNISRGGALITSSVPIPLESVQPLQLSLEGQAVTVDARVRHIRRVSGQDQPARYLIGVEFLSIPPALAKATDWLQV